MDHYIQSPETHPAGAEKGKYRPARRLPWYLSLALMFSLADSPPVDPPSSPPVLPASAASYRHPQYLRITAPDGSVFHHGPVEDRYQLDIFSDRGLNVQDTIVVNGEEIPIPDDYTVETIPSFPALNGELVPLIIPGTPSNVPKGEQPPAPTNDQTITGCVPEVLPDGRRVYKQWKLHEQTLKLEPLPDVVVPGPPAEK